MAGFWLLHKIIKSVLLLFVVILTIWGNIFSQSQTDDFEVRQFREIRDKDFKNPQISPLLSNEFENFKGLNYFPFDKNYRISAKFEKSAERKSFLMPTSTGSSRRYLKIGDLSFKLGETECKLSAFTYEWADDHPKAKEEVKEMFVPFKDLTNAKETYSVGRYVYLRIPKETELAVIDFNLAYNPNCAYGNNEYSCTLPPKENFLKVEIRAGEKNYK